MWNQDSQDIYPCSLQERPPPVTSQDTLEFAYLFNFSTFITYVWVYFASQKISILPLNLLL